MWLMSLSSKYSNFSFRKTCALAILCLSVLLMSWESQKNDAALLQTAIPEESIRLRILAHSDSPQDQAIKMLVRDRVVEHMNTWATEATTIEAARGIVNDRMQTLNEAVGAVLAENGQTHSYTVSLAEVEFPTKAYGGLVYPGGDYEAVLITIGEAKGRNWWCVLFPPLCFVDTVSGEAVALEDTEGSDDLAGQETADVSAEQVNTLASNQTNTQVNDETIQDHNQANLEVSVQENVEVKFFLADVWSWFTGLFA